MNLTLLLLQLLSGHVLGWQQQQQQQMVMKMTMILSAACSHALLLLLVVLQLLFLLVMQGHATCWHQRHQQHQHQLAPLGKADCHQKMKRSTASRHASQHLLLAVCIRATGLHHQQKQQQQVHKPSTSGQTSGLNLSGKFLQRGVNFKLNLPAASCQCSSTAAMQFSVSLQAGMAARRLTMHHKAVVAAAAVVLPAAVVVLPLSAAHLAHNSSSG
jgi:hypothetical protein